MISYVIIWKHMWFMHAIYFSRNIFLWLSSSPRSSIIGNGPINSGGGDDGGGDSDSRGGGSGESMCELGIGVTSWGLGYIRGDGVSNLWKCAGDVVSLYWEYSSNSSTIVGKEGKKRKEKERRRRKKKKHKSVHHNFREHRHELPRSQCYTYHKVVNLNTDLLN